MNVEITALAEANLEEIYLRIRKDSPNQLVIWWCGHFQSSFDGGPTLSPGLLRRLGDFGADLFIDNYFAPQDEAGVRSPP